MRSDQETQASRSFDNFGGVKNISVIGETCKT